MTRLVADRKQPSATAEERDATTNAVPAAAASSELQRSEPAAVEDVTQLSAPAPCVLCQLPTTTALEGFPQHVSAEECAAAASAVRTQEQPTEASGHQETDQREPAPTREPEAPQRPRPAREGRSARPRQERSDTKDTGVAFLRRNIHDALEKHDGDLEAAQAFLVRKAIPHAMELLDLTRRSGRYDIVAFPFLPDILRKPTKDKPDQIWEARPRWSRSWDSLPPGTHSVDELDINGAYLSALKTHLPSANSPTVKAPSTPSGCGAPASTT